MKRHGLAERRCGLKRGLVVTASTDEVIQMSGSGLGCGFGLTLRTDEMIQIS